MSAKDIVLLLICIASAIGAIVTFWSWINTPIGVEADWKVIAAIAGLVVAIVSGLLFLIPRVNKEEEIHITQ